MKRITTLFMTTAVLIAALAPAAVAQTETIPPTNHLDQRVEEPGASLERIKAAAVTEIERRLETLDRLTEQVGAADHITATHASALLADYRDAESGLRSLSADIEAASTIPEAITLTAKIATDYRIYLVVAPKTFEVAVSDTVVAAAAAIEESGATVQAVIDALGAVGVDVTEAQHHLDGALGAAGEARALAGPVADRVIGLDAADWQEPADSTLQTGRADLEQSGDRIRVAVEGIREAIRALSQR